MVSEDRYKALEKVLRNHTGGCRTMLRMEIPKRSETVLDLGDDYKVAATDELLARIEQDLRRPRRRAQVSEYRRRRRRLAAAVAGGASTRRTNRLYRRRSATG